LLQSTIVKDWSIVPTVSVVVPSFNRARWLPHTVESILRQTFRVHEILIVDDGSTDDTEQVCASLPAPCRYVRQDNRGAAAARNRGMREAAGEWIAFVDSDDLWEPSKLEVQLAALEATATRWSATDCVLVDQRDHAVEGVQGFQRAFPVFTDVGRSPEEFFSQTLRQAQVSTGGSGHRVFHGDAFDLFFRGNFALTSTVMLHRTVVEEMGGFDETYRVAEDTEYFHRIASRFPAAFVMTALTRWRVGHDGRITSSGNVVRLIEEGLSSLDGAARLRGELSPAARRAYRAGRALQVRKLAYAHLSLLNGAESRTTLRAAWQAGIKRTPADMALYAASLLPGRLLEGLGRIKRRVAERGA